VKGKKYKITVLCYIYRVFGCKGPTTELPAEQITVGVPVIQRQEKSELLKWK
jgi:hypothetical protein